MSNPSAEGSGRPVRIVPLPAARLPEVGAVFAGSHGEYPPFRHLFPDPTRRAQVLARLFTATVRDALPFGTADAAIADDGRLLGGRVAPTWGVPLEHLAQAAVDADVAWSGLGGARRLPGLRAHGGQRRAAASPRAALEPGDHGHRARRLGPRPRQPVDRPRAGPGRRPAAALLPDRRPRREPPLLPTVRLPGGGREAGPGPPMAPWGMRRPPAQLRDGGGRDRQALDPGPNAPAPLGTREPWLEDAAGVTPLSRRRVAIGLD